ncbi:MAG TPA: hypothetical protein VHW24_00265 [Bryobacteraceae bacterium]|nr:hypothetical protein [Bryobacteraceae bacterium]
MGRGRQVTIRLLIAGVLATRFGLSQNLLSDAKRIADAQKYFEALQSGNSGCEVLPIQPHFIFSLRIQAGYAVRLPSVESAAQEQGWVSLTRITPQVRNRKPVYLSEVVKFSVADLSTPAATIEGSYSLGEGRYDATFLMFNSRGDVCRKDWQIDARLNSEVSKLKPLLAPGEVGSSQGPALARAVGSKPGLRVTILLHAASVLQGQTLLTNLDKTMLLDGVVALMQELPASSVRLVVFNLEERKQLLSENSFTLDELASVAKVLDALQPAALDYRAIQLGSADFIESLLTHEMRASAPSEAVILLGPKSIYKDKPSPKLRVPARVTQGFFYLLCDPTRLLLHGRSTLSSGGWQAQGQAMGFPSRPSRGANMGSVAPYDFVWRNYGPNHGEDTIEYAVGRLRGKTMQVDSPASFADAVSKLAGVAGKGR